MFKFELGVGRRSKSCSGQSHPGSDACSSYEEESSCSGTGNQTLSFIRFAFIPILRMNINNELKKRQTEVLTQLTRWQGTLSMKSIAIGGFFLQMIIFFLLKKITSNLRKRTALNSKPLALQSLLFFLITSKNI